MIAGLPVEVEKCIVDPEEQCPVCRSPLTKVGEKVVRTEVVFQPAQLKVRQYVQEVYKYSRCGKEGSEHPSDVFVGGKVPVPLLPHSLASASLVAGILYKKYDMGIPLARQERDWYRLGLCLYRSTMANWVIRCSEEYLLPIYERIHQYLLGCGILHKMRPASNAAGNQKKRPAANPSCGSCAAGGKRHTGSALPLCRALCWSHARRYYIDSY